LRDVSLPDLIACSDEPARARYGAAAGSSWKRKQELLTLAAARWALIVPASRRSWPARTRVRATLYEIGTVQMEAMLVAMRSGAGFCGGRQAGSGFGGCTVAPWTQRRSARLWTTWSTPMRRSRAYKLTSSRCNLRQGRSAGGSCEGSGSGQEKVNADFHH